MWDRYSETYEPGMYARPTVYAVMRETLIKNISLLSDSSPRIQHTATEHGVVLDVTLILNISCLTYCWDKVSYLVTEQDQVTEHDATTPSQPPVIATNPDRAPISCRHHNNIWQLHIKISEQFRRTRTGCGGISTSTTPKFTYFIPNTPFISSVSSVLYVPLLCDILPIARSEFSQISRLLI